MKAEKEYFRVEFGRGMILGGYMRLRKESDEVDTKKCIKAMNGGIAMCLLWLGLMCILGFWVKSDQLFKLLLVYSSLFPLNCILIAWKVIREKKTLRCV